MPYLHSITKAEWAAAYGSEREPKRVLDRTRTMLKLAQRGLDALLTGERDKQVGGICDVAVYGRSVTLAAQAARTETLEAFDQWYAPWQTEMHADELFRYFNKLRTEILHEGSPREIAWRGPIDDLKFFELMSPIMDRIQEEKGEGPGKPMAYWLSEVVGVGVYEITKPDGQKVRGTVQMPLELWENHRMYTYLPAPPRDHLGTPIKDVTLQNLATLYLKRLDEFVASFAVFISSL